jgi:hypothetical protein
MTTLELQNATHRALCFVSLPVTYRNIAAYSVPHLGFAEGGGSKEDTEYRCQDCASTHIGDIVVLMPADKFLAQNCMP